MPNLDSENHTSFTMFDQNRPDLLQWTRAAPHLRGKKDKKVTEFIRVLMNIKIKHNFNPQHVQQQFNQRENSLPNVNQTLQS